MKLDQNLYCEISLKRLEFNYKLLEKTVFNIFPVVKSYCYGFGFKNIIQTLYNLGARCFCVADLREAMKLRKINSNIEIIVFNGFFQEKKNFYQKYKITPCIINEFQLEKISNKISNKIQNKNIGYWIMVDTGMNRTGISMEQFENIKNNSNVLGVMSHFLNSQTTIPDETQRKKIDLLASKYSGPVSFLKSAVVNLGKNYRDFARIGHSLYFSSYIGTVDIARVKATIISINYLKSGESVGYDKSFTTEVDRKTALVNCGYSSGIVSNHPYFIFGDRKCQVLGRVSMDFTIVDISEIENVSIGDEIYIYKDNFSEISEITGCSMAYLSTALNREKTKFIYKDF